MKPIKDMALIEVVGTIKSEPLVIKSEPSAVVEIYPADVFHPSDEEDEDKKNYIDVVKDEAKDEDDRRDNDFCATENLRTGEHLVLNFNKQVVPQSDDNSPKESSSSEKVNWANLYRTQETIRCSEDQRKVKKVYGSSWNKPIQQEEYTRMSKTSIICNYCNREFKAQKYLTRHIKVLHRESSLLHHCPYCPKQSKWNLRYHILTQHKGANEVNWFQCYQCDKKYRMKNRLVKHIGTHMGKKWESSATCSTCERVFNSRSRMRAHARRMHEGGKNKYSCVECSFSGQFLDALKHHVEVHHTDPNELPIYQCSKCAYKTRYKRSYTKHCKKHETTYFCDRCAFMTNTSEKLNLHVNVHKETIDDESLRYHCNKCDYKTYRVYNLQVHKLNHLKPEEINYFYCYHCNFKANRKDNLKTHIIRHFKKEEVTLHCFICDFKTKKRAALTKHINGHQKSPQSKKKNSAL